MTSLQWVKNIFISIMIIALISCIKGPAGPQGTQGLQGTPGTSGVFFYDTIGVLKDLSKILVIEPPPSGGGFLDTAWQITLPVQLVDSSIIQVWVKADSAYAIKFNIDTLTWGSVEYLYNKDIRILTIPRQLYTGRVFEMVIGSDFSFNIQAFHPTPKILASKKN